MPLAKAKAAEQKFRQGQKGLLKSRAGRSYKEILKSLSKKALIMKGKKKGK